MKFCIIFLCALLFQSAQASKTVTHDLKNKAFSDSKTMPERWKAFMELVKIKNKESLPDIQRALNSDDWFMRDAAIKALLYVDSKKAVAEAKKILKEDPALVVRTSAVEILRFTKDKSSASALWKAFEDKKNFRKNQSLWIRPRILSALIEMEDKNFPKYKAALKDNDKRIQKMAKYAIDKFTRK